MADSVFDYFTVVIAVTSGFFLVLRRRSLEFLVQAVLYISDMSKWPIQVWLRQIVLQASGGFTDAGSVEALSNIPQDNIVKAVIVVATILLVVYPFLQKYSPDSHSLIVRIAELEGRRGKGSFQAPCQIGRAVKVNLLEDPVAETGFIVDGDTLAFDYLPNEILTFRIEYNIK